MLMGGGSLRRALLPADLPSGAARPQVEGVRFISQSIAAKQVAVILDLDGTLLESEHLPIAPMNW